mmetsp:Transcript_17644/g.36612  ORF Transcript_17644/g.36612 Transcript_17644/m.36612 type:complete len:325 (-) Transcript_17644:2078-3052(-)
MLSPAGNLRNHLARHARQPVRAWFPGNANWLNDVDKTLVPFEMFSLFLSCAFQLNCCHTASEGKHSASIRDHCSMGLSTSDLFRPPPDHALDVSRNAPYRNVHPVLPSSCCRLCPNQTLPFTSDPSNNSSPHPLVHSVRPNLPSSPRSQSLVTALAVAEASPVASTSPRPELPSGVNDGRMKAASRRAHCKHSPSEERRDLPRAHYIVPNGRWDWRLLALAHCLHLSLGCRTRHGRVKGCDTALSRVILSPSVHFALCSDCKTVSFPAVNSYYRFSVQPNYPLGTRLKSSHFLSRLAMKVGAVHLGCGVAETKASADPQSPRID